MSEANFEVHMKHLRVLVKWNRWWNLPVMAQFLRTLKFTFSSSKG